MANILIVDDEKLLCEMVSKKLSSLGHASTCAHTLAKGLKAVSESAFDLVLLDVHLPDGSGLEALSKFKSSHSQPEIIIITGEGDPGGAELAIETGAWDYIEKPLSIREITLQVTRALQYRQEKTAFRPAKLLKREGIIGGDPKMEACLEQVVQCAGTDAPVLVVGETGTGKELFARAVHVNSSRSKGPFVVLDCTAFPENLVASMLFGHRKGAFTGADRTRRGLILEADKGTLFMDEVGELPLTIQKSFLRVLQEHRFRPVGGQQETVSDFRLVAATNRDLEKMVHGGLFRKDLMYRLRSAIIHLPPLKERKADIYPLALHYISGFCIRYSMGVKGVSPEFLEALQAYAWPGNVRELINAMDCAIANAQKHDVLFPMHLPANIRISLKQQTIRAKKAAHAPQTKPMPTDASLSSLKASLENAEKRYLEALMIHSSGDIQAACRISGLSRSGLYARLKKYDIERPV
ncbi:MAG: sigma-54 dependent transcriptional regulator [Pseudomonadota bacterium]